MIISINGKAGSGKSSVAKALAKKIGYKTYSAGDIWRKCASDRGLTLPEFNKLAEKDPSIDKTADDALKNLGETEDNLIVESRLGFLFIPKSIKIFFDADDVIRAKRTTEAGRIQESAKDLDEALAKLKARDEGDVARYKKLYGVDPYNHKYYDLVVDTSHNTVDETLQIVYDFLSKKGAFKK
jgi:cytidylate kinase